MLVGYLGQVGGKSKLIGDLKGRACCSSAFQYARGLLAVQVCTKQTLEQLLSRWIGGVIGSLGGIQSESNTNNG